jgi:hypothetical protein
MDKTGGKFRILHNEKPSTGTHYWYELSSFSRRGGRGIQLQHKADYSPHLVPRIRISGAMPPLPSVP